MAGSLNHFIVVTFDHLDTNASCVSCLALQAATFEVALRIRTVEVVRISQVGSLNYRTEEQIHFVADVSIYSLKYQISYLILLNEFKLWK